MIPLIHILFPFQEGPWGGGNQFLKALRDYFILKGVYSDKPDKAEAILFNSHHLLEDAARLLKRMPDKIMIHRVDGPLVMVRGTGINIDKLIFKFNDIISDGTIFQSRWSQLESIKMGMKNPKKCAIIINSPRPDIFYRKEIKEKLEGRKIKLLATSWSANYRKGFDVYSYLDKHLDLSRYEMTFIGNSPVKFYNIRHISALESKILADAIRKNDIFITASINDPCSNSLIEAIHCGLPAVVRDSGGHPEILGKGGTTFTGTDDVCDAIDRVASNYSHYVMNMSLPLLEEIGEHYYMFIKQVYDDSLRERSEKKKINTLRYLSLLLEVKKSMFFPEIRHKLKQYF